MVYLFKRDVTAGGVVAACVASHWLLDFFTHRPDLPLTLSETTKVGLGLWNFKTATFLVESLLFAAGVFFYVKKTHAIDNVGRYAFWSLIIFLALISVMNMVGPPPPDVGAIAWAGHLQWLFVLWGYWADAHRKVLSVKS